MANKRKQRKQHRLWPVVHTSTIGYLVRRTVDGHEVYEWVCTAHPNRKVNLNDYRKFYE